MGGPFCVARDFRTLNEPRRRRRRYRVFSVFSAEIASSERFLMLRIAWAHIIIIVLFFEFAMLIEDLRI